MNIYITGTELRSDAIRVATFKQKVDAHGNWNDADVDAREHQSGETPLMIAASRRREKCLKVLLSFGADPSLFNSVQINSDEN